MSKNKSYSINQLFGFSIQKTSSKSGKSNKARTFSHLIRSGQVKTKQTANRSMDQAKKPAAEASAQDVADQIIAVGRKARGEIFSDQAGIKESTSRSVPRSSKTLSTCNARDIAAQIIAAGKKARGEV